ncbi:LOW QUALITY PROTEIN: centrosome-associated protein 350 [Colossoma macropomum]|uniref:LOW QUALITY PROTEIN: centrosome-associated protein 350 n=1 Tax=Colossoma macropomum TaxID=42526 RepID=UPI001863F887|nr:LOW QUALITY PROTEIN: centrosome-associated protein 350 [Colossoma macropomum]
MWSGQRGEAAVPPAALDNRREISSAWRNLNQSKAALRHIENRLEAVVGSGVVLDTLMNTEKTPVSGSRKARHRERRGADDSAASKSQRSRNPEKSSRSPLRNSTQDNSTERPHTHASHREVSPPVPRCVSDLSAPAALSEQVYERDSRPDQTADLDSTRSSALENTTIRFLNDPPVPGSVGSEVRPGTLQANGRAAVPPTSVSSSPGSASVRLEKLRQRRTDGKLEKLKERIRRQREQLEEAAERERIISHLEQPVGIGASLGTTVPTAKVRKVAPAPPAPIYKGFNTSETTIRTADGKVWGEEEFHNCSREFYMHQLLDGVKQKPKVKEKEKVQERKAVKPVRKIHRSASVPDQQTRPVISTSSWREGQKLVKMILGPSPRLPSEPRAQSAERERRTGASSRTSSDPRLELNRRSRPNSSERPAAKTSRPAGGDRGRSTAAKGSSRPAGADRDTLAKGPSRPAGGDRGRSPSTDLLSADIRGILDDLQLEGGGPEGPEEGAGRKSAGRSGPAPVRSSRSTSPAKPRPERKRQYNAEEVRQYIARQQEDRKKKQAEERRSQKEAEQRRCQRLQELYRRQREGVAKPQAPPTNPPHSHLQETYTKLLLEHTLQQPRPVYQPSGESDKENKRQEPPSPSHSDLSVSEHGPPALSRAELGMCSVPSAASLVPSAGQLFSQLLSMEGAAAVEKPPTHVDLSATHTVNTEQSRTNRIDTHLHSSRLSRVEALKASAASLSSRIEKEARKLAGDGINYGINCSRNAGTGLPTVLQDDDALLVKTLSPPVRESPGGAADPALRIQRLLRAGQSAFGGDPAELPGVGNLYSFGSRERGLYVTKTRPPPTGHTLPFTEGVEPLDSSRGSISEGPLTDSSLSEGEDLRGDSIGVPQSLPKPSLKLAGADYCATLQNGHAHDPITLFQREAEQHSPYRPGAAPQDSWPLWDDLAKGSPHSVINIFTKNMHNYSKVMEVGGERVTPVLHAAGSASNSLNGLAYEDDFVSSRGSSQSASKRTSTNLSNGHSAAGAEERRENEKSSKSSSSTPLSSPHSTSKRGSDRSLERPLVDGQKSTTFVASELQWNGVKKSSSPGGSPRGSHRSADTDSTAGGASVHSVHSVVSEGQPSSKSPAVSAGSPATSPRVSPPNGSSHSDPRCSTSSPRLSAIRDHGPNAAPDTGSTPEIATSKAEFRSAGPAELQFAPGVLQQRLSAELSYLDAVEESVRQLGDVERVRAVSLAQQESVSLAQILKAQQQRQERELQLLKLKAEQEALETQRQLQESRERAAQAHTDLCVSLVQSQQQALLGLQESSSKIISQQAETAQHTVAAARHIREMTDLARSQMLNVPSITPLYDQQRQPRPQTDSRSEVPPGSAQSPTAETPPDSLSESVPSRRPTISGGGSSSRLSPSLSSSVKELGDGGCREHSSSVEEEVHTAAEESLQTDSIQSILEDRADSASVATEYSMKFDESVTEDELEKSFRSLLPSESHWRDSIERNRSPLPESDEERSREKSSPQLSNKDSSMPFSSGQDSFNKFTMAMVKQYMQEEEVRAQHQSSLLRLRHRALKEKTKAELAWLEHQKRRLRDKGEDDKMPPIRKRQRGLLLKLQQEQAEIRRLQEANRAARKERQLLLKQQEEIERIHHSTLRLREKLRSAGDNSPRSPVSAEVKEAEPSLVTDTETRSPSPLSVSGSETSSIMQKLKKMRYQMDERQCSPVLCFFSVFGAQHWASLRLCLPKLHPKFQLYIYTQLVRFLTEREQRLVRRRLQAEELLQWRQRLDAEEAAVRRMEKQALAAWEQQSQRKHSASTARDGTQSNASAAYRQDRSAGREAVSEDDSSPVSSVRSPAWVSEQLVSPSSDGPASKPPSSQTNSSPHIQSAQPSESHSRATSSNNHSLSGKLAAHSSRSSEPRLSAPTSEAASDQSDIEGRVLALKEELRRRKAEVQRLKKAQKQRHKERLKAQEASLLKQLESYNNFIEKTKAELSKEADSMPTAKPQIKTPASGTEKPRIRAPAIHRPEAENSLRTSSKSEEKILTESLTESAGHSEPIGDHEVTSSDEDPPTVTPTPVFGSPEHAGASLHSPEPQPSPTESPTKPQLNVSADQSVVTSQRSEVIEELDYLKSEGSGDDHDLSHTDQNSPPLLKLDLHLPSHRAEEFELEGQTALSGKSSHEAEEQLDSRAEDIKSSSTVLNKQQTREEPEAPAQKTLCSMADSYSPDFSPRKEDLDEHKEAQSPSADGYNDDFESSIGSSFQEDNQESKSTSPSALQPKETSYKSSFFSSEEEIDEDLSVKSGITSGSFLPERPLDLDSLAKPSKESFSDDVAGSPKSPVTLPSLPPRDEMPSYCIGDRVLVSNIQPGTLRFKGQTIFANGFWAGVELDESEGSNDGTYDGVMYFQCKKGHGIFAPPDKVTHLPEKFESYVDTTEDEDSSLDDQTNKAFEKNSPEGTLQQSTLQNKELDADFHPAVRESSDKPSDLEPRKDSKHDLEGIIEGFSGEKVPVPNGRSRDIILEFEDVSNGETTVPINIRDKAPSDLKFEDVSNGETTLPINIRDKASSDVLEEQTVDILDLLISDERSRVEGLKKSSGFSTEKTTSVDRVDGDAIESRSLSSLADKLLDNFVDDAVRQFQEIKKMKEKKIAAANQQKEVILSQAEERVENNFKTDHFRTFFDKDQEEVSSPELCNRSESPVLGPSGQEELAKRLAELELSRELLDALGDEQDWFDEDFGLSSRKEQEKLKRRQEEGSLSGSPQAKVPARPQLPQPKLPEEPAMLVPHTAPEVEKLVSAALLEIWKHCGLGQSKQSLTGVQKPQPSEAFLSNCGRNDEQEADCIRSYKQAVFDLSWEVIQDVFKEDPNADQPQWVKPRRVNSSCIHRINDPSDITKVQTFVTSEVLKLYGLKKEQNHKTDWQKMLKFGRKKRDRVDHILVQELHEEEALWVNYDEDELFVKMQLADGIFDALLKDTAEILIQIQEKRSKRPKL